jgi:hypothetical protein
MCRYAVPTSQLPGALQCMACSMYWPGKAGTRHIHAVREQLAVTTSHVAPAAALLRCCVLCCGAMPQQLRQGCGSSDHEHAARTCGRLAKAAASCALTPLRVPTVLEPSSIALSSLAAAMEDW